MFDTQVNLNMYTSVCAIYEKRASIATDSQPASRPCMRVPPKNAIATNRKCTCFPLENFLSCHKLYDS